MPGDIKLIGLDLDETILNAKKELTPRVRRAIERALAAGITVLPATGRALDTVPPELMRIADIRFALTSNGAAVYDVTKKNALIISHCFTRDFALEMLELCLGFDALTSVYVGGKPYSPPFTAEEFSWKFSPANIEFLRRSRIQVPDLREVLRRAKAPIEKFAIQFRAEAGRRYALDALAAYAGRCTVTSSLPSNLELNAQGANKGASLLELGRMLGFGRGRVMAIGDGTNDVEMLQAVGYGVAMGNAVPEVLAVADAVTAGVEEDGAALAIEAVLP